ncbi:MAG: helix-turn-helix domain-containing protein [Comamonas sp.]
MAPVLRLLPDVVARHRWPGNARELHNFAQRVAVRCVELAGTPDLADLIALIDLPAPPQATPQGADASLVAERAHHELRHIQQVLTDCDGDHNAAAKALGISRTTLWRKLKDRASA